VVTWLCAHNLLLEYLAQETSAEQVHRLQIQEHLLFAKAGDHHVSAGFEKGLAIRLTKLA
jgi:hypothetical protein